MYGTKCLVHAVLCVQCASMIFWSVMCIGNKRFALVNMGFVQFEVNFGGSSVAVKIVVWAEDGDDCMWIVVCAEASNGCAVLECGAVVRMWCVWLAATP